MTSRRTFLRTLLGSGASAVVAGWPAGAADAPLFTEVPPSVSGITWVHDNAMSPARFLPESLGPGCAFLDYDNDGWMDLYLVNSGPSDFYKPARPLKNALYHNNRDGTFTDVTDKAGVAGGTFGMGVAVGDYDNDGFPDMFVSAYGRSILYRNNHDGTFTDVTAKAGLEATAGMPAWTTSAVWFDYDNDGRLDLFVGSYVQYQLSQGLLCAEKERTASTTTTASRTSSSRRPALFTTTATDIPPGQRPDGHRPDAWQGARRRCNRLNNDGLLDLVVANDTAPNFLFLNRGNNVWRENGVAAGMAFSASGNLRSGMGVDAADFNGDGWQDVHRQHRPRDVLAARKPRRRLLHRRRADHGLAQATRLLSGWGAKLADFDNDGFVDLLIANGPPGRHDRLAGARRSATRNRCCCSAMTAGGCAT